MPRKHLRIPTLCAIFLLCSFICNSQTVVNAAGNTISSANFVFEYSIGEISITTHSSTENTLTQGLLQPNLKVSNPGCTIINSELLSFENPTRDKVRIVGRYDWITDYQIYAADGKLVRIAKFQNNHIDISTLPAAVYFIRLLPGCNGNYRTLKLLKQ
ncbi:MAG TPA: T9SS type A sorting domain-containing protein [Flavisolibacter sp.]|jgi:hypothetical protein|nr:T9SS type A sorting domain-containing protein [Flavisolibacter sp.]